MRMPVKNIRELIALARAKPDSINYASSGTGANVHLITEMFTFMTGTRMVHIQYKGTGPGVIDTIAGQTSLVFGSMSATPRSKEVSDQLLSDGLVPSAGTPEEFGTFIANEIEVVRKIVARAGIKAN